MSQADFRFTSYSALMMQADDPKGRWHLSELERAFYDAHDFELCYEMSGYDEYFSPYRVDRVPDIIWLWRQWEENVSANALQGSLDLLMLSHLPAALDSALGLLARQGVASLAWQEGWQALEEAYETRTAQREEIKDAFLKSLKLDPYTFWTT